MMHFCVVFLASCATLATSVLSASIHKHGHELSHPSEVLETEPIHHGKHEEAAIPTSAIVETPQPDHHEHVAVANAPHSKNTKTCESKLDEKKEDVATHHIENAKVEDTHEEKQGKKLVSASHSENEHAKWKRSPQIPFLNNGGYQNPYSSPYINNSPFARPGPSGYSSSNAQASSESIGANLGNFGLGLSASHSQASANANAGSGNIYGR